MKQSCSGLEHIKVGLTKNDGGERISVAGNLDVLLKPVRRLVNEQVNYRNEERVADVRVWPIGHGSKSAGTSVGRGRGSAIAPSPFPPPQFLQLLQIPA